MYMLVFLKRVIYKMLNASFIDFSIILYMYSTFKNVMNKMKYLCVTVSIRSIVVQQNGLPKWGICILLHQPLKKTIYEFS